MNVRDLIKILNTKPLGERVEFVVASMNGDIMCMDIKDISLLDMIKLMEIFKNE